MSIYILRWNPAISSYKKEHHKDLVLHMNKGEYPLDFNWSIKEWEDLKEDDFFILQQVGTDNDGIAMIGKFKGPCYESVSWKKDGSKIHYADMWIMEAFDCYENNILPASKYETLFPEIKWHGGHSGVVVKPKIAGDLIVQIEKDMIKTDIWDNESLNKFRAFNGPQVLDDEPEDSTENILSDERILLQLKHDFLEDKTEENFARLLCCLHDSTVIVPTHVEVPEEVKEKMQQNIREGKEDDEELIEKIKYFPMTVTNDGDDEIAMAIFSNEEEIRGHYTRSEDCVFCDMSVLDCIDFLKDLDGCDRMVLDPFGESFMIDNDLASVIENISFNTDESDFGTEE